MKSHREVLIRPIALSLAAILLTSLVVAEAYSHAKALHVRDPEDLALAFLLPTICVAVFFGSTLALATSFGSGLAAAYLIYPPQASIWMEDPNHVAELGFILLLAITASKAVGVIIDGKPLGLSAASAATDRRRVT
jgi:K+-sensing histidine kinase KdpD